MSDFEQARQTMLAKLLELRGTARYADPTKLAPILGRSLIDIADDAWTLKRQGYVTILEAGDQSGPEGGDEKQGKQFSLHGVWSFSAGRYTYLTRGRAVSAPLPVKIGFALRIDGNFSQVEAEAL